MCGILLYVINKNNIFDYSSLEKNLLNLKNRGPDFSDSLLIEKKNIDLFIGHTRLSIQDTSSKGNQPMMKNKNGILIFNGEIYNHHEIRKMLTSNFKVNFISNSDTETLYYLLQTHTIETALNKLTGMFSFCYYNQEKEKLVIARDRAGEKPMYLISNNSIIGISSDINNFKKLNPNYCSINKIAVKKYTQLNYIPTPLTIYNNCYKLPAASFIEIDLNKIKFFTQDNFYNFTNNKHIYFKKWWQVKHSNMINNKLKFDDSKNLLKDNLYRAVKSQLISDVPIGAYLSSGIDSSIIVSLMSQMIQKLDTFTIGFENKNYDESISAKKIANYYQTNHYEKIMTVYDIQNIIPDLSSAFSEPFADSSQLPSLLIAKFAKNQVKVVLTGDGGDELFGGYNRYILAFKYWKYLKFVPNKLIKVFLYFINFFPEKYLLYFLYFIETNNYNINNNLYKKMRLKKFFEKLNYIKDEISYYKSMTQEWFEEGIINYEIDESKNYSNPVDNYFGENKRLDLINKMMLTDFNTYLSDDILCKVDRATMNYGLESRAPFLDHKLIDLAYSMPLKYKFQHNKSKFILRNLLNDFLPKKLISQNKKGFAIPISEWINKDLKEWSRDMLSEKILKQHNLFDLKKINMIINEYEGGYLNHEHKIWSLIQFNNWFINHEA